MNDNTLADIILAAGAIFSIFFLIGFFKICEIAYMLNQQNKLLREKLDELINKER